jgi:hypothetical protein
MWGASSALLQKPLTDFAMIHVEVMLAERQWLDVLITERRRAERPGHRTG